MKSGEAVNEEEEMLLPEQKEDGYIDRCSLH